MSDPRMRQGPNDFEITTDDDGVGWAEARGGAKFHRGDNRNLRSIPPRSVALRVFCSQEQGRRSRGTMFAVVEKDGPGLVLRFADDFFGGYHLDVPVEGGRLAAPCACGRVHAVDQGLVLDAVERLRHLKPDGRWVDLSACRVDLT